jgi:hypothetical protein
VVGIGGGTNGRFGIYLINSFLTGSSSPCDCFKNDILSKNRDFTCVNVEAWGLDYF